MIYNQIEEAPIKEKMRLSHDISIITAEINSYKQVAGQAIFEIGRRLKHVKENDLVHGEWNNWCESIGISRGQATKFITVYDEFGSTSNHLLNLGTEVLYQIATMPEEEREKPHAIPSTGEEKTVDEMTVRELREVKKALKEAERKTQEAEERAEVTLQQLEAFVMEEPKVIEKEIEVIPANISQQLEKDKEEIEHLQEKLNSALERLSEYELKDTSEFDEKKEEIRRKKMIYEADRNILEVRRQINELMQTVSMTAFMKSAIAASTNETKGSLWDGIRMLEGFISEIKLALNGRIEINKERENVT